MKTLIAVTRWLALLLLLIAAVQGQAVPLPATIRVVLDDNYPPYIFRDANGQVQGIIKDLWDLWQQRTGVTVEFQPMDWSKARATMESGEADVIDTIFDTEERRRIYDFSRPYARIEVPIFFHRSIAGITDAASLTGFTVGVKEGDACIDYLKANGIRDLKPYVSYEAQVGAAVRQEIRVLCIDTPPAVYFFNRAGAADEFRHSPPLYVGEFHWAVARGRTDLKSLVEDGFSRITDDERAAIETRWLGEKLSSGFWTGVARYGRYVLLAVALAVATLLTWSWTLRRRVATRTAALGMANSSLRDSEARFRSLINLSTDWYWQQDAALRFVAFSGGDHVAGWGKDQLSWVGLTRWEIPGIVPISGSWPEHKALLEAHSPFRNFEYQRPSADGSLRYVAASGEPVFDGGGRFVGYRGVATDITERKAAEHRIQRLNRVYAVLSGINTLIVHVRDRDEVFTEACRIAVDDGRFQMAWIGVVDRSAMKIVPLASAGASAGFLEAVRERLSLLDSAPLGHGPPALAVREKQAVVVNDVAADPRIRNKTLHADLGIRSSVSLPLLVAGEAVGVFCIHATEVGYFDEAEMKLLRELAGNIAFAIDHLGKQEQLDYLAYYDELTGLANRRLFLERVAQYMRSAVSGGHRLALFLIDLERFKNINDSLGRPAGDALLRQVAEWLTRNTAGDANLVARVGADHFAVVMPQVKREGTLVRLLEKWFEAFLNQPFRLNDAVFRISHKVGVALFPDDGTDAENLFRNAEAALKAAKASGERYLFYKPKMTDAVAGKLTLESQLRQALDNGEFVLHYQPKVNLASGKITSAEALIRWNDPRTGLVPPGRFIPILEETGLIYEVGRWALRQAIADYLRWRTAGLPAVRIAVNVSPMQLRHRDFIDEIEHAITIDPQAAAGLELEITESLIMEDIKHNIASLQAIRDMGVTIAIDDFGTGFSSLSYLAKLPVDALKIDRSFVIEMTLGPEGLALVSTIIKLGHSMKLKVVAEGVETEEQQRLLRLLNCDEMQGYLFSKPVPAQTFEARFLAPPVAG